MMKRIKAKLIGKGSRLDGFRVNLPTYAMDCQRDAEGNPILSPDGFPLDSVDYTKKTCYVLVPDDEVEEVLEAGKKKVKLNEKRIREKYKKYWGNFKAKDVEAV